MKEWFIWFNSKSIYLELQLQLHYLSLIYESSKVHHKKKKGKFTTHYLKLIWNKLLYEFHRWFWDDQLLTIWVFSEYDNYQNLIVDHCPFLSILQSEQPQFYQFLYREWKIQKEVISFKYLKTQLIWVNFEPEPTDFSWCEYR